MRSRLPRPGGRWRLRALVVLGVALVGVAAGVILRGGHPVRHPGRHPDAYRIVYRVEDHLSHPIRVTTDVLEVSRPFLGSMLTHAGDSADGPLITGQVDDTSGDYYVGTGAAGAPGVTAREYQKADGQPAAVDLRLQPALTVAAHLGLVGVGGQETVAGIRCTDYLSAGPLDGGAWTKPTTGNVATTCVSGGGFLLHEVWVVDGKLARTRTARSVEQGLRAPFVPLSGLRIAPLDPNLQVVGATPVPTPAATPIAARPVSDPAGLPPAGVFDIGELDPTVPGAPLASSGQRQIWSDGHDVVVLTQVRSVRPQQVSPIPANLAVDLGALGKGELLPGPHGLQITVQVSTYVTVTVTGTIGEDALLAWVRSLTDTVSP
ncbi:MAG TPA: hypothetical protein VNE21_04995 [Mycobacteriales bacterium]|nr:hypothetical protein [Mycobacteriales bacterium]